MDEDQELLQDFRTESLEHMSEIEPLFLEIEELEGDAQLEVVNQIFRAAHSVKGAAGFFGLDRIQNLAHTMENLLMRVRDGELLFRSEMTDALLAGVDKLSQLIEALPEVLDLSIDSEVAALKPLIEGEVPDAVAAEQAPAEASEPDAAPAEEAPVEASEPDVAEVTPASESAPEPAPEGMASPAVSAVSMPDFEIDSELAEEAARFGQRIFGVVFDDVVNQDRSLVHDKRQQVGTLGKILGTAANPQDQDALALQVASV
ncbi:MAG: hypothetical protein GY946_11100, partial [bacterium]|nr:hypothetical protein [bacterium]